MWRFTLPSHSAIKYSLHVCNTLHNYRGKADVSPTFFEQHPGLACLPFAIIGLISYGDNMWAIKRLLSRSYEISTRTKWRHPTLAIPVLLGSAWAMTSVAQN